MLKTSPFNYWRKVHMDEKKKKYISPEADILEFANDDIITLSAGDTAEWTGGEEWWVE